MREPPNEPKSWFIQGILGQHGKATPTDRPFAQASYLVEIYTSQRRERLFNPDLERALKESLTQPKPGELVGVRMIPREQLVLKDVVLGLESHENLPEQLASDGAWFVVENLQFFHMRSAAATLLRDRQLTAYDAIRVMPALKSFYFALEVARQASSGALTPGEGQDFQHRYRELLARHVEFGGPLPTPELKVAFQWPRERGAKRSARRSPERAPER